MAKKELSKKHQQFVAEYLKCFNGVQAYMAVYKGASYQTAVVNASKLLTNTNIQEEINEYKNSVLMQVDEAMKLTNDIARGDIAQMMDISSVGFNLDMSKAQELGLTGLIKKVKQKTTTFIAKKESEEDREITELEIELYDRQAALRDILKMHGKFIDRTELTGKDGKDLNQTITIFIPDPEKE